MGVKRGPNRGLIWEVFALLNRLKNSATTSRRFAPPNGKYFRMRKSIVASLGVFRAFLPRASGLAERGDRKSTRLNSSHQIISYAVFCLKKKNQNITWSTS